ILWKSLGEKHPQFSLQSEQLPEIKGDAFLLSLLFRNLLENAIKFKKDNHEVVVKVHYLKEEINFHPKALKDVPYHVIAVTDNGIGFAKEYADKIFAIFYPIHNSKNQGSGLGLAVSK